MDLDDCSVYDSYVTFDSYLLAYNQPAATKNKMVNFLRNMTLLGTASFMFSHLSSNAARKANIYCRTRYSCIGLVLLKDKYWGCLKDERT